MIKKDNESLQNNTITKIITPPDPGYEAIRFLSWLKKRGGVKKLSLCIRKWQGEGLDINNIIRTLGNSFIRIYIKRGEKVVVLINSVWANQWMRHYHTEIPHHRHSLPLERIISITEKKRKV